jgi:hypothetical protein
MKAEEIREYPSALIDAAVKEVGGDPKKLPRDAAMMGVVSALLAELTAQVAEANEHLAKIANPLMVVVNEESPWVMLSDGKTKLMIDRREVIGVRRSGPEVEMMSQVNTRGVVYIVQGTVVEVCKKLGIPTE